jgi:hypothetical protein
MQRFLIDLLPRLQALLTRWDGQAATAAHKLERSRQPTGGAYYAGAKFGYENSTDGLCRTSSILTPTGLVNGGRSSNFNHDIYTENLLSRE